MVLLPPGPHALYALCRYSSLEMAQFEEVPAKVDTAKCRVGASLTHETSCGVSELMQVTAATRCLFVFLQSRLPGAVEGD